MVYNGSNPIKMDDLGATPIFWKHPYNLNILESFAHHGELIGNPSLSNNVAFYFHRIGWEVYVARS